MIPLAIINITGGVEQWTITCPGTGDPDVHLFDFDDEMDDEDMEILLTRWLAVIELARDRVPADTLANMEQTAREWREKIELR